MLTDLDFLMLREHPSKNQDIEDRRLSKRISNLSDKEIESVDLFDSLCFLADAVEEERFGMHYAPKTQKRIEMIDALITGLES